MNWAGLSIAIGLIGLAVFTLPYGLLIVAVMVYVFARN